MPGPPTHPTSCSCSAHPAAANHRVPNHPPHTGLWTLQGGSQLWHQAEAPPAPHEKAQLPSNKAAITLPPTVPSKCQTLPPTPQKELHWCRRAVGASQGSVHWWWLITLRRLRCVREGRLLVALMADVGIAGVGSRNLRAGVGITLSKVLHPHFVPLVSEGEQETLQREGGSSIKAIPGCGVQGAPLRSSQVGQSGSLTQEKMEKKLKVMAARAESAPMYTSPGCVQDHWLVRKQKPMNHRNVQRPVGGSGMRGQGWSCCSRAVPGPDPAAPCGLAQAPGQGQPLPGHSAAAEAAAARGPRAERQTGATPFARHRSHVTGQGGHCGTATALPAPRVPEKPRSARTRYLRSVVLLIWGK